MRRCIPLLLLIFQMHFAFGMTAMFSDNDIKRGDSVAAQDWQDPDEMRIEFFQSLSEARYTGYQEPDYEGEYQFGDYACYVSGTYLTETSRKLEALGAPSLSECVSGKEKAMHYQEYISFLRSMIDSDEILHKEGAIEYAWTNERGVWLIGIELYVTELTVHVASRSMDQRDFNLFLEKHKQMMDTFRKMFTRTYHFGSLTQMSGLTGDTCRDCWPFLRLYNASLYEMLTSGNMETLNKFYEIALPFAEQSLACGIMYEELINLLRN